MKKVLISAIILLIYACTPKSEEGERNSGTIDSPGNVGQTEVGQPTSDSTSGNSSSSTGNMAPADATQENQGSKTSGAAGQ